MDTDGLIPYSNFRLQEKGVLFESLLCLIIPVGFFAFGVFCLAFVDESLTFDGFLFINASRAINGGYGYLGHMADTHPPLYPLLTSLFSWFLPYITAAKVVSLLAAFSLLSVLPFLSKLLGNRLFPGLVGQMLLGFNPEFLFYALQAENHMLDAFLFVLAVSLGIQCIYFSKSRSVLFVFLVVSFIAALTRYTSVVVVSVYFVLLLFSRDNEETRKINYILLFGIVIYTPWFFYYFYRNGQFLSGFRWNVIGPSLISNQLINETIFEWYHLRFFKYDNFFNFMQNHKIELLKNFSLNLYSISKLLIFQSPLKLLSFVLFLGLLNLAMNSWKSIVHRFVLLVIISYSLFATLTFTRWVYFIHVSSILIVAGFIFLHEKLARIFAGRQNKEFEASTLVLFVVLSGSFFQIGSTLGSYKQLVSNNFRDPYYFPDKKASIEKELLFFRERLTHLEKNKRVMSLTMLGQIYRAGFKPIAGTIPKQSILETLCYMDLSKKRRKFLVGLNFPPNKSINNYVPPDYFIVDKHYLSLLESQSPSLVEELKNYISRVRGWDYNSRISLFKVNKKKIDC